MMKKLFLLLFPLLFTLQVYSQSQVDDCFADNGISTSRHNVKTNLLSAVYGNPTISYEIFLSSWFSLEASAGIISPYYIPNVYEYYYDGEAYITNPESGYSYTINPKFWGYKDGMQEGVSYGFLYQKRNYNLSSDSSIAVKFYGLGMGYQWNNRGKWMWSVEYYEGLIERGELTDNSDFFDIWSFSGLFTCKIGYIL